MTLRIAVLASFLMLAGCTDGDFAYLEYPDGGCMWGQMIGGLNGASDHFCANDRDVPIGLWR